MRILFMALALSLVVVLKLARANEPGSEITIGRLVDEFKTAKSPRSDELAIQIASWGPEAKAEIPFFLSLLVERKGVWSAKRCLASMGAESVPNLVRLLETRDPKTCSWVIYVLHSIGEDAEEATQPLINIARATGQYRHAQATAFVEARKEAIKALGVIAAGRKGVISELMGFVSERTRGGSKQKSNVEDLVFLDRQSKSERAVCAVRTLGRMGPKAKSALPHLAVAVRTHPDAYVRSCAIRALTKINHPLKG